MEPAFCATLADAVQLFQWLRKTPSDQEFASSIEMSFTKPELEVPPELWNNEKNSVYVSNFFPCGSVSAGFPAPSFPFLLVGCTSSKVEFTFRAEAWMLNLVNKTVNSCKVAFFESLIGFIVYIYRLGRIQVWYYFAVFFSAVHT
jgi:hypothetical protein